MKRLIVLVLALVTLSGCGVFARLTDLEVRDARVVSNAAALTLEATQVTAELLYELEQRGVKEKALREPDMTKKEIRRRLAEVRKRWDPVQELLVDTRKAHAKLAATLEAGDELHAAMYVAEYAAKESQLAAALAAARTRVLGR